MSQKLTALVTGATSGIGAATAKAFASQGYQVVLSGRRAEQGEALVQGIISNGGEATFVQCDISDPAQIQSLIQISLEAYGTIDAAFNNAGIEGDIFVPFHEQSLENYQQVFDINVRGVFLCMKAQIPCMLKNGGAIINNASISGLIGFAGMSLYTASKHAVIGLTKAAALEYAQSGLRVNAVAPGAVETEMYQRLASDLAIQEQVAASHPIGRAGLPEEIANTVLWLADQKNSFTTGQCIACDGGYTAQ